MAMEEVNTNPDILPNHTLHYLITPTECNRKIALDTVVRYRYKVDAYVGPGCSSAAASAALLASYWNIPMLALSGSGILADKSLYDTLTRTTSPKGTFALVITKVIQQFRWHRIGLLKDRDGSHLNQIEIPLLEEFSKENNSIAHVGPFLYNRDFGASDLMYYKAALLEVVAKSKGKMELHAEDLLIWIIRIGKAVSLGGGCVGQAQSPHSASKGEVTCVLSFQKDPLIH